MVYMKVSEAVISSAIIKLSSYVVGLVVRGTTPHHEVLVKVHQFEWVAYVSALPERAAFLPPLLPKTHFRQFSVRGHSPVKPEKGRIMQLLPSTLELYEGGDLKKMKKRASGCV